MYKANRRRKSKPPINKELVGWPLGYRSSNVDGGIPEDALADLTNMDLTPEHLPTPRWSTTPYGASFIGTCTGMGLFEKTVIGTLAVRERYEISMQAISKNATQNIVITGTPTGGTFTLTYSGQTTAAIARNASASTVRTALEALSNIAPGDIACTGGALPGTAVIVEFTGTLGNTDIELMSATSSLTGGTSPATAVQQLQLGGIVGRVFTRKDAAAWAEVAGNYAYDNQEWTTFTHSNDRSFITTGVDSFSYYDILTDEIAVYTELADPTVPPSITQNNLTGTSVTLFYTYTAINEVGQTLAAVSGSIQVSKNRESWNGTTETIDLTATAVPGADGYNFFVGTAAGQERLVGTITSGLTFRDDGRSVAAITARPPISNSTLGPILKYTTNILGQVWGWGDKDNPSYVWYDGGGEGKSGSGNFTISGGGGYIGIDDGGPSVPMAVFGFRTGKGDPVPTVICRAAASSGGVRHITLTPQTIGDLTALMPSVSEANGADGTISPRAVVLAANSVHFPTGSGFKYYGSAPNIPNILEPDSSSDFIQSDVRKLSNAAMDGAVGLEFEGRIYFALPVISNHNNQIWILDLTTTPARWIMPWIIPAKHMWLYEDNTGTGGGTVHFCLLVNNKILEFTRAIFTEDDGIAFPTRLATGAHKWSKSGAAMGYIQKEYLKLLAPRGTINIAVTGEGEDEDISAFGQEENIANAPNTGWGQFQFGESEFGEDPGSTIGTVPRSRTVPIEVKETMSESSVEITTETAGCNYTLESLFINGLIIPKQYAGD